jgi:hypothetical protein
MQEIVEEIEKNDLKIAEVVSQIDRLIANNNDEELKQPLEERYESFKRARLQ